MKDSSHEGCIVLISGASRGLGYSIAEEFLSRGYDVFLSAKSKEALASAVCALEQKYSSRIYSISMDLNDRASMQSLAEEVISLSYKSLIMVNNAGLGYVSQCEDIKEEDVLEIFNVNCLGHIYLIQKLIPKLKNGGTVINVFSVLALRPISNWSLYSAAKSAFSSFSIGMQMEYASHGINVLNVYVGRINTEFTQRALGVDQLKKSSTTGAMEPHILAHKIYKKYSKKRRGQMFIPLSTRILFFLHAISIDLTSVLLNRLLKKNV